MAIKTALLAGCALLALAQPSYAIQQPVPGKADSRIRYVPYDPNNVTEIWTTPSAIMSVEFSENEKVLDVMASDVKTLKAETRANFLFFHMNGCLIPEPVIVLTKNEEGKLRRYTLQVETHPQICPDKNNPIISASTGEIEGRGNLRYIGTNALGPGADVGYTIRYLYPGDEAARRREAASKRRARLERAETAQALKNEIAASSNDPYSGDRNYRYAARGDGGLQPSYVFDNGYMTSFVFPALQRVPSLFRVDPDGKEGTADFSVHGNTVVANGTAQEWRLRDGGTVMEVWDLGYTTMGSTPGTGTASPQVQRVLKGAADDR